MHEKSLVAAQALRLWEDLRAHDAGPEQMLAATLAAVEALARYREALESGTPIRNRG